MASGRASSRVWRMRVPPGTSPTPVLPALSSRMTTLRVKNGPCAPLKLSSMLSWPATGTTIIAVTTGGPEPEASIIRLLTLGNVAIDLAALHHENDAPERRNVG